MIENNQRRIALLEKMAEEIYREWFVRFRFPGHEKETFTKGLPARWEKLALSKLGDFLNGYAFKPKDWHRDGIPIIKIKEMTNGISDETPKNSGVNISRKYFFDDGDIIFSWSATLLVKLWVHGPGLLNQHLFKVTPLNGIPKSFLYFSIQQSLQIFESLTTGATMKHIRRNELNSVKICLPPRKLLIDFDNNISCVLNKILILNKKNRVLEKTRNLLLPRLISGKLSVENLDIQFPPSMQAEEESNTREAVHA